MKRFVWCTTQFEGIHRWKDAPEGSYLQYWHRHMFHAKVLVAVEHGNRDVEFIELKLLLEGFIEERFKGAHFEFSCEQIAEQIFNEFKDRFVIQVIEVSEDGENGATLTFGPKDYGSSPVAPQYDCMEIKSQPFQGIEAEGPMEGCYTIFVPGCTAIQVFESLFNAIEAGTFNDEDDDEVDPCLYFGAGNERNLNKAILKFLIDKAEIIKARTQHLTIEYTEQNFDDYSAFFSRLRNAYRDHLSLVGFDPTYSLPLIEAKGDYFKQIDFKEGFIYWKQPKKGSISVWETALDDPRFSQDTEILFTAFEEN